MICALSQPSSALLLFRNAGSPPVAFIVAWNLRTATDFCELASGNTCTSARPRVEAASLGSSDEITVTERPASGTPCALARKACTNAVLAVPVVASSTAPGRSAATLSASSAPFLPSTASANSPPRSTLISSSAVDMSLSTSLPNGLSRYTTAMRLRPISTICLTRRWVSSR